MNRHLGLTVASTGFGIRGCRRLCDQQIGYIGAAIFVDDEAYIGLVQTDAVDVQALAVLVVEPVKLKGFPEMESFFLTKHKFFEMGETF